MTTNETITPKKKNLKQKRGEILRFLSLIELLNKERLDIAKETDVSLRTINNAIYENAPLGPQLLRGLHLVYGVSINWLVSGHGNIFVSQGVNEDGAQYGLDNSRKLRINKMIHHWIDGASEDEQAWLEVEIRRMLNGPL